MRKGPSRDEIIALFTVSGMSAIQIADRFGVSRAWVYMELKAAGLQLRPGSRGGRPRGGGGASKKKRQWRESVEVAVERMDVRIAPPPPADPVARKNPDLFHCLGVLRANDGCGFPFGVVG